LEVLLRADDWSGEQTKKEREAMSTQEHAPQPSVLHQGQANACRHWAPIVAPESAARPETPAVAQNTAGASPRRGERKS